MTSPSVDSIHLAFNLKRLRRREGINQEQLAERVNLSVGTIKQYETCKRWPADLHALAAALNAHSYELLMSAAEVVERDHAAHGVNPHSTANEPSPDNILAKEISSEISKAIRAELGSFARPQAIDLISAFQRSSPARQALAFWILDQTDERLRAAVHAYESSVDARHEMEALLNAMPLSKAQRK